MMCGVFACSLGCLWGGDNLINWVAERPCINQRVSQEAVRTFKGYVFGGIYYGVGTWFHTFTSLPGGPPSELATTMQAFGSAMPVLAASGFFSKNVPTSKAALVAGAVTVAACMAAGSPLAAFLGGGVVACSVLKCQSMRQSRQVAPEQVLAQATPPPLQPNADVARFPTIPTTAVVEIQTPTNQDAEKQRLVDRKIEEV